MSDEIREEVVLAATPIEIYELFLDSNKHAAFTGKSAAISRELGERGTAYDGQLEFVNRELVPGERIAQDWRADWENWPADQWSRVTVDLSPDENGTRLLLTQTGVPEHYQHEMSGGWNHAYWEPMTKYLEAQQSA